MILKRCVCSVYCAVRGHEPEMCLKTTSPWPQTSQNVVCVCNTPKRTEKFFFLHTFFDAFFFRLDILLHYFDYIKHFSVRNGSNHEMIDLNKFFLYKSICILLFEIEFNQWDKWYFFTTNIEQLKECLWIKSIMKITYEKSKKFVRTTKAILNGATLTNNTVFH